MLISPEGVFILLFSIVTAVSATMLWNSPESNKKAEQLSKVDQR